MKRERRNLLQEEPLAAPEVCARGLSLLEQSLLVLLALEERIVMAASDLCHDGFWPFLA